MLNCCVFMRFVYEKLYFPMCNYFSKYDTSKLDNEGKRLFNFECLHRKFDQKLHH